MRPDEDMPRWRRSRLGAGALMLAIPTCAAAYAANQALAAPAQMAAPARAALRTSPRSIHVSYGDRLVLRGTAASTDAGHTVVLQFARRGQSGWRQLSSTTVGAGGRFRLTGAFTRSGVVRAVDASTGTLTPFVARGTTGRTAPASTPVPVDVTAGVRVPNRQIDVLGSQAIRVQGRLLPARAGRRVSLETHRAGRWQTLASRSYRRRRSLRAALRRRERGPGAHPCAVLRRPAERPLDRAARARSRSTDSPAPPGTTTAATPPAAFTLGTASRIARFRAEPRSRCVTTVAR